MNVLSINSKLFQDAEEIGCIIWCHCRRFSPTQNNRAVRLHKKVHEPRLRLAWKEFIPWFEVNYFLDGGFTVQRKSQNPFGKIPADQAIDTTINKDTQTSGACSGI